MLQIVCANDCHSSQLFQWDKTNRVLSLPHDKKVWYCKLNESNDFICQRSEPKPKRQPQNREQIRKT